MRKLCVSWACWFLSFACYNDTTTSCKERPHYFRCLFCLFAAACRNRDKAEGIVHLLVYSEEELREQDKQIQQKQEIKPLCDIGEETQDPASPVPPNSSSSSCSS